MQPSPDLTPRSTSTRPPRIVGIVAAATLRRVALSTVAAAVVTAWAGYVCASDSADEHEATYGVVSTSTGAATGGTVVVADPNAQKLDLAERYFRKAELADPGVAWRESYYRKAEALAEAVLESDPNSAQAHFLLFATRGRRILDTGPSVSDLWQLPALNKHLQRALELDPSHAHALAAKGGMLLDLPSFAGGDIAAARRYLEQAVALNPVGPATRLTLAKAMMKQGQGGAARSQLLAAAHYACVLRRKDELEEADELLSRLDSNSL